VKRKERSVIYRPKGKTAKPDSYEQACMSKVKYGSQAGTRYRGCIGRIGFHTCMQKHFGAQGYAAEVQLLISNY